MFASSSNATFAVGLILSMVVGMSAAARSVMDEAGQAHVAQASPETGG